MKTVRTFLAVNLELETIKKIGELQRSLIRRTVGSGAVIKWVPPGNMHLTLRFLGDITEPMIEAIRDRLAGVIRPLAPVSIEAKGLGFFPPEGEPAIIWAGVEPSPELQAMYDLLCDTLTGIGFIAPERPFASHVTLGRIKSAPPEAIAALRSVDPGPGFGTSVIRDLLCYASILSSRGSEYRLLWRIPLETAGNALYEPLEVPAEVEPVYADGADERDTGEDDEPVVINDSSAMADEDDMDEGEDE